MINYLKEKIICTEIEYKYIFTLDKLNNIKFILELNLPSHHLLYFFPFNFYLNTTD